MTGIRQSWSRRSLTDSPKRLRSTCARVRREFWGYAADEALSLEALLSEQHRGIRPAPGYPAQPDHTEKGTLFKLHSAEQQVGMRLTESFAISISATLTVTISVSVRSS